MRLATGQAATLLQGHRVKATDRAKLTFLLYTISQEVHKSKTREESNRVAINSIIKLSYWE